jgi:phospholipase/carboxylesterase
MKLKHLVRQPKVIQEKAPLLLLLHGYGSNEADLFSFANELPDEYLVISAQAPYSLGYGSYAWYAINFDADEKKFSDMEQAKTSRDLIVSFIDELILDYNIDYENITLIGFSQGAILSFAVGLSFPDKIKRVVAMSGYLNTEMLVGDYASNIFDNFKIFQSHGTVDQVVPVDWARKAKPFLEDLKIEIEYNEYPIGHGISPQNFYDFRKWLEKN